ncbi:DNA polymerase [Hydrogenophaga crassostreae]|uniref:DNA polymerase n=1 Tax=Hydrogenophaga crassostreae TaxID=1763535 RepID=A0A167H6W5_9BURK|nr:DNA polymerase Y family protein [Hydrogenophaga crassostreae]AOW12538.1 DNA polymerase [Hydrogenophaga crassostreae]OAD40406.1 DNA polymerase [Hydrogenophaga crassostreae]
MLWSALLLLPPPSDTAPSPIEPATLQAVAIWALQFTPRVALADDAVLMEVAGSVRLFGGRRALRDRVWGEGQELGVGQLAWAPNSLAALALARAGRENGLRGLDALLDALPMMVLSAVRPHALTLAHIGCRTLGDVRALPRGGIARRFDKTLLHALDQAYGLAPEGHTWVNLPETFEARLELVFRVDDASALLFGARRLLLQMCGWLAARHSGVTAFTLHWSHDVMRSREAGEGGQLTVGTAEPMRDVEHLCRLLAEHLAKVELAAPVGDLRLTADTVHRLTESSASLLPDNAVHQGETLHLVLERLAARLGPERVLRPVLTEDHRQEWMCRWQAAPLALPKKPVPGPELPQPTFVLPLPLRLAMRGNRPIYQGELQLLAGPQRVEGGWWDRVASSDSGEQVEETTRHVARDYWVALSALAGVLWVFQTRLDEAPAWYLHGHFA